MINKDFNLFATHLEMVKHPTTSKFLDNTMTTLSLVFSVGKAFNNFITKLYFIFIEDPSYSLKLSEYKVIIHSLIETRKF